MPTLAMRQKDPNKVQMCCLPPDKSNRAILPPGCIAFFCQTNKVPQKKDKIILAEGMSEDDLKAWYSHYP